MRPQAMHATWVEVNLQIIESNVRKLADLAGRNVMVVLKADAYGHGASAVARAALRGGAAWLGVARVEEAIALRREGFGGDILILGLTPQAAMQMVIEERLSFIVWLPEHIQAASQAATKAGATARVHLKVDTGMSRIGVQPEKAITMARQLAELPQVDFEGILTHFASSDEADPSLTEEQEALFRQVIEGLETDGLRPPFAHAANSAAALSRPSTHFDIVRAGIATYGLDPSTDCRLPTGFEPALSWKSQVSQIKRLPGGRGVSYGHEYVTRGEELVGSVPVGYGDGFRRTGGNQVLVRGKRVPVIGRVCMDQIMVQMDAVPDAEVGDEVVLIGTQGSERISADDLATNWGTINYEVVCGINPRVPRVYSE